MLVSVVIANYNYAEFLAAAVDSALGIDWPSVEVIVVDDGSTDDSRAVMERYGDRITALYEPHGGQIAAYNAGFARARGELIIFLDADDILDASLVREVAPAFRPGVSKVQVQMKAIDRQGRPVGSVLPQYGVVPTPEQVRSWTLQAASYPTPPGSGNVYARDFLEAIFPLEGRDTASDSYCLSAAPLLGDVVTIAKPLVSYRVHGRNVGAMATIDVSRFAREIARATWRFQYQQRLARSRDLDLPDESFDRSLFVLQYRIASLAVAPERHPIADDSRFGLMLHFLRAAFVPQGIPATAVAALVLWGAALTVAPPSLKERFVAWRFASVARPRAIRRTLKLIRAIAR